ncbi:hypothetical protein AMECASPLE_028963 [Ameca splendens]|uniref:Ig-like domain-containing protein n=1 Tax=Ameca splendens TaxID=208324 RepID=A0ABV0YGQ4_9TELE
MTEGTLTLENPECLCWVVNLPNKLLTCSQNMLRLSTITLLLLPWIPVFLCKVTTEEEFTVLEGGSLTIPCHYEPQYVSYVKYWCQGRTKEFCTILARTDDHHLTATADQKVNIFDDPVQLVFTVTMNDMKEGESGWYMCGVEIGGMWNADDTSFTNIKVIHDIRCFL